jgi:hypothetical protein
LDIISKTRTQPRQLFFTEKIMINCRSSQEVQSTINITKLHQGPWITQTTTRASQLWNGISGSVNHWGLLYTDLVGMYGAPHTPATRSVGWATAH